MTRSKIKFDPENLDAAVEAMYAHYVGVARQAIDQTEFDVSTMPVIFRRLHHDSETSQVLVVASYLEDRITALIQCQLIDVASESAKDKLFGSNGPLGSLGSRITISYHLGWISKESVNNLNNFRKIRNIFAHNAFRASYNDQEIKNLFSPILKELEKFDNTSVVAAMKHDHNKILKRVAEATEEKRNLCGMALLAGSVFRDLLILPEAKKNNVSPNDIIANFNDSPKVVATSFVT